MDDFIRSDPVNIVFKRSVTRTTTNGGFREDPPQEVASQQVRLIPFKRRRYDYTHRTASGDIPVEQYELVGRWDIDIQRDDEFVYGGDNYKVISVEPKLEDRTRTDRVVAQVEIQVTDKHPPV